MPAPAQKITAWSFSRLQDYRACPAKAKYKHILRMREPSSPAAQRGTDIHLMAEQFTKGELKKLPEPLAGFKKDFAMLKKVEAACEEQWAYGADWGMTGWFDKDVWLRVKLDVHYVQKKTLFVVDHKTGKENAAHLEQLSLYALAGMLRGYNITGVVAQLWYLDHDKKAEAEFTVGDMARLQRIWQAEVKPMLSDTKFVPNPGTHCRWCAFSKAKGGPCKF